MSNPFFNGEFNPGNNEHDLYNNATNEIVQIGGIDMYYIPRENVKEDHIFGEDVLSSFENVYKICFYIENFTGYSGTGDLFTQYGFQMDDILTLISQQDEFRYEIDPDGNKDANVEPNIGDLIFHEASKRIFQITHVETDDSFYQFSGENMSFKLTCKLFNPSSENFDTGIADIDQFTNKTNSNNDDELKQIFDEKVNNIDFSETDIFGNI